MPVLLSLNPCSGGLWFLCDNYCAMMSVLLSLNPCSGGLWFLSIGRFVLEEEEDVLILVLVDYGF